MKDEEKKGKRSGEISIRKCFTMPVCTQITLVLIEIQNWTWHSAFQSGSLFCRKTKENPVAMSKRILVQKSRVGVVMQKHSV
jgi:hypothetical protein